MAWHNLALCPRHEFEKRVDRGGRHRFDCRTVSHYIDLGPARLSDA